MVLGYNVLRFQRFRGYVFQGMNQVSCFGIEGLRFFFVLQILGFLDFCCLVFWSFRVLGIFIFILRKL